MNKELKSFKEVQLPTTLAADSIYYIQQPTSTHMSIYVTDGNGVARQIINEADVKKIASYKYTREWHVDVINGSDSNNGSYEAPFKTVAFAQTKIGGSGEALYLHAGIYTETIDWSDVNADIVGSSTGGLTRLEGNWTFSHTASSVRVRHCRFAGSITHSGSGSLYFSECQNSGAINKTGAGYFETNNCDFAGAGFTVSGAGFVNLYNTKLSVSTINNASAVVTIQDSPNSAGMSIVAGNVLILSSLIFSSGGASAALASQTGGTVFIRNTSFYKPDGTFAPISLLGAHSIDNSFYDDANSVLTGLNLGQTAQFDSVKSRGLITASSISIPWVQTKAFASGVIVEKDSKLYQSNAAIPANTAFSEGTTGATWKLIGGASSELITTSLTPSVANLPQGGDVEFVDAQADTSDNVADVIKLSDGSFINTGKVTWTDHGLDVGAWYYLSQDTAGEYVTPAPTEGILQKLFFVEDENIIHINVIGAASAIGGSPAITNTTSETSPSLTDPALNDGFKNQMVTITDGADLGDIFFVDDNGAAVKVEDKSATSTAQASKIVISNSIGNPGLIRIPGRYIIPTTGLSGEFVGKQNQYADWNGELSGTTPTGFVYTSPTTGDKHTIVSGTNAGKVYSWNGSWIVKQTIPYYISLEGVSTSFFVNNSNSSYAGATPIDPSIAGVTVRLENGIGRVFQGFNVPVNSYYEIEMNGEAVDGGATNTPLISFIGVNGVQVAKRGGHIIVGSSGYFSIKTTAFVQTAQIIDFRFLTSSGQAISIPNFNITIKQVLQD